MMIRIFLRNGGNRKYIKGNLLTNGKVYKVFMVKKETVKGYISYKEIEYTKCLGKRRMIMVVSYVRVHPFKREIVHVELREKCKVNWVTVKIEYRNFSMSPAYRVLKAGVVIRVYSVKGICGDVIPSKVVVDLRDIKDKPLRLLDVIKGKGLVISRELEYFNPKLFKLVFRGS